MTSSAHALISKNPCGSRNGPGPLRKRRRLAACCRWSLGARHGRAFADTHKELARVTGSFNELVAHDFVPFKALNDLPMAMTALTSFSIASIRNAHRHCRQPSTTPSFAM